MQASPSEEYDEELLLPKWGRYRRSKWSTFRRTYVALFVIVIVSLTTMMIWTAGFQRTHLKDPGTAKQSQKFQHNRKELLLGTTPGDSIRSRLLPDRGYVTIVDDLGGFSNQFYAHVKLFHLADLLDRIAIIPPLYPNIHVNSTEFRDFFDYYEYDGLSAVSLSELKNVSSPTLEDDSIMCWSILRFSWNYLTAYGGFADKYKVHVGYWPMPGKKAEFDRDVLYFEDIVSFEADPIRQQSWIETVKQHGDEATNEIALPSKHFTGLDADILCYESTFYLRPHLLQHGRVVPGADDFDSLDVNSGPWHNYGRHIRFSKDIRRIGDSVLSELGLTNFIGVHVRHGDFTSYMGCQNKSTCYNLDSFVAAVKEMRIELGDLPVVVASDDRAEVFRQQVADLGWVLLSDTTSLLKDPWLPQVVDSYLLSLSRGFVGSKHSSFSILAANRVQSWNNGPVRSVASISRD